MKSLFAALMIFALFTACKKDRDYPPAKNEPTRDSLLVSNIWQIQKIHVLQNNVVLFYERGGQNNDYNYDNDFLKFEKNGTGTYTAGSDVYNITWHFDNTARTEFKEGAGYRYVIGRVIIYAEPADIVPPEHKRKFSSSFFQRSHLPRNSQA